MKPAAEEVASDWINYVRHDPNEAPKDVFDRGWVLYDLVGDKPQLAWDVIKAVVGRYTQKDLFLGSDTVAQRVIANTAAGPLEDLLSRHGQQFIEAVETEARRDRRMAWALSCVWQNAMSDEIWTRVQRAATGIRRR